MTARTRVYVASVAILGTATLAIAVSVVARDGVEAPLLFLALLGLTTLGERLPFFLGQGEGGEGLDLSEGFLIAAIVLLPPAEAVLAFTLGTLLGEMTRRPAAHKIAFNLGQFAVSAFAAVVVVHMLVDVDRMEPSVLAALVAGAVIFGLLNSGLVAGAIALSQGRRWLEALRVGLGLRAFIWAANVSLGLLVALVASAHPWAIPFLAAPILLLHLSFASRMREHRAHQRMAGLFQVAVDAHASMGAGDVVSILLRHCREQLQCKEAYIAADPGPPPAIGAALRDGRWLVAADSISGQSFQEADRRLLEAIAVVGASALDNALLYERVAVERRKLADVVEGSSDGIFSLGDDGTIQSWNPAMARIAGVPSEEAAGRRLPSVVPLYDTDGNSWLPSPALVDEPSLVEVRLPGDEHRWLSCSCSPLPEGGVVVVARDITAQREVDELKADFLATVSHELRTPLTPIKGFLATLRDREDRLDNEQRKHVYEVMAMQANRLERLVSDLLDATVLDRHEVLFLTEEVDWQATVDRVIDLFGVQAPDREIVAEVSPALPAVLADEQRAEQVLSNLLANAIKYSPPGASVRVVVEERDGDVVTTLIDQGPGVAPAQRARIFDRFVRLGEYQTRSSGGAGLGLYIARQLVEAMGGTIYVEEGPEGGSAFSFTLPTAARDRSPR